MEGGVLWLLEAVLWGGTLFRQPRVFSLEATGARNRTGSWTEKKTQRFALDGGRSGESDGITASVWIQVHRVHLPIIDGYASMGGSAAFSSENVADDQQRKMVTE